MYKYVDKRKERIGEHINYSSWWFVPLFLSDHCHSRHYERQGRKSVSIGSCGFGFADPPTLLPLHYAFWWSSCRPNGSLGAWGSWFDIRWTIVERGIWLLCTTSTSARRGTFTVLWRNNDIFNTQRNVLSYSVISNAGKTKHCKIVYIYIIGAETIKSPITLTYYTLTIVYVREDMEFPQYGKCEVNMIVN